MAIITVILGNQRVVTGTRYGSLFYNPKSDKYFEQSMTQQEYEALGQPNPIMPTAPNPNWVYQNSFAGPMFGPSGFLRATEFSVWSLNQRFTMNVDDWLLQLDNTVYQFNTSTRSFTTQPPGATIINGTLTLDESFYKIPISMRRVFVSIPN